MKNETYLDIFKRQTFTLFNLINLVLAILIWTTGSLRNMLFMGTVISNWAIGMYQEIKAKRTLDRLALLNQDRYTRLIGQKRETIIRQQIRPKDILLFSQGDQIPCDCTVLNGSAELNESILTGESDEVFKQQGDTLLSGTFVVSGTLQAIARHTGKDTYANTILEDISKKKKYPSQLRDGLDTILKYSTLYLIPAGILLFLRNIVSLQNSLDTSILDTAAAIIGMIPEGLIILTSIALAMASIRLAQKDVLVQELYCTENLARTDILCLDKTGTLTQGKMKLTRIIVENGHTKEEATAILAKLYGTLNDTNATAQAILHTLPKDRFVHVLETIPFSSKTKSCAVKTPDGLYQCGAYSFMASHPDQTIQDEIETWASKGFRTLTLMKDQDVIAILLLQDPIKPDAAKTLNYFKSQDVQIKIISGDDPATVQAIAAEAGISGKAVNMRQLSEKDIETAALTYNIFGRTSPIQKKQLIKALQKAGHTVAMTGDGVNDVMALRQADCSIAMASGSQAARSVSSLILLNDQFDDLPAILLQGRTVINNITRAASLFLVKTLYSMGLTLCTLLWMRQYPFQPIQLTLISSLATGIPSFFLALEPNTRPIEGNFLKEVLSRAIPGALNVILLVIIADLIRQWIPCTDSQYNTICTILTGINGLCVLANVCRPCTVIRKALVITMSVFFALAVFFLGDIFLLERLSFVQTLEIVIIAAAIPFTLKVLREGRKAIMKQAT